MEKYEALRSKLEAYIEDVLKSVEDMQSELNDEKGPAKDITDARRLFELTVENIETRVAVMEMLSVVDELKAILDEE